MKFLAAKIAEGIADGPRPAAPGARSGWAGRERAGRCSTAAGSVKPDLIPADPFGNTTDKVQMNPGHQAKGLVEPAGPVDPEVSRPVGPDGRRQAARPAGRTTRCTTSAATRPLSADYFGAFAERDQAAASAPKRKDFVGIMSNGTSGDVNNINFGGAGRQARGPGEQIQRRRRQRGDAAAEAYREGRVPRRT